MRVKALRCGWRITLNMSQRASAHREVFVNLAVPRASRPRDFISTAGRGRLGPVSLSPVPRSPHTPLPLRQDASLPYQGPAGTPALCFAIYTLDTTRLDLQPFGAVASVAPGTLSTGRRCCPGAEGPCVRRGPCLHVPLGHSERRGRSPPSVEQLITFQEFGLEFVVIQKPKLFFFFAYTFVCLEFCL